MLWGEALPVILKANVVVMALEMGVLCLKLWLKLEAGLGNEPCPLQ